MAEQEESSDSDSPIIDDNVIRIQLRKPSHRKWELRTRNFSPGIKFPTIQLFDCEGNLLIETNDENISIQSSCTGVTGLKSSQSLKDNNYKHVINKNTIRKHKTISGDRIYTKVYNVNTEGSIDGYIISNDNGVTNIPNQTLSVNGFAKSENNTDDASLQLTDVISEISSYKSSDNDDSYENILDECNSHIHSNVGSFEFNNDIITENSDECNSNKLLSSFSYLHENSSNNEVIINPSIQKSKSFNDYQKEIDQKEVIPRSKSGIIYTQPQNKISFLNTYLKSLPARTESNPDWFALSRRNKVHASQKSLPRVQLRDSPKLIREKTWRFGKIWNNISENDLLNIPTDVAAECEFKKRLKIYRRGVSEVEQRYTNLFANNRRHSISAITRYSNSSSSESVDEADLVLNRLRRRILKNKMRAKKELDGKYYVFLNIIIIFDIILILA